MLTSQAEQLDAWLSWLTPLHPTLFVTITSENRTHPESLLKRYRYATNKIWRGVYGNQWRHNPDLPMWIYGMERHASYNPHGHAAIIFPPETKATHIVHLKDAETFLTNTGGFCRVELSRNPDDVKAYVLKYCIKDGDLELSPNFDPRGHRQCTITAPSNGLPSSSYTMGTPDTVH